jgi:plastocyanin
VETYQEASTLEYYTFNNNTMKHVSKPLFAILILILSSNSSFGQETRKIELSLDPIADTLYDPGETKVNWGDTVLWIIKTGENIDKFKIIGKG